MNARQQEIVVVALSYLLSNLDDVNEAVDKQFAESEVQSLLDSLLGPPPEVEPKPYEDMNPFLDCDPCDREEA